MTRTGRYPQVTASDHERAMRHAKVVALADVLAGSTETSPRARLLGMADLVEALLAELGPIAPGERVRSREGRTGWFKVVEDMAGIRPASEATWRAVIDEIRRQAGTR